MKKLFIFAICLLMVFCMTGCVNDEIVEIYNAKYAAEEQYTSYDYENASSWFIKSEMIYDDYSSQIVTFGQDEYGSFKFLTNGDAKGHISVVNNKGTKIESSMEYDYYQRGDYAYYDVGELGRYWQKARKARSYDTLDDYISNFKESDFKAVKVTELENGGKRLYFKLNPSAIPDETASEYLLWSVPLPIDSELRDPVSAELISLEHTLELDKNFVTKRVRWQAEILLRLKNGFTARAAYDETIKYTKYYSLPDDHIVFPKDLSEYSDHETYMENLRKLEGVS